ncbi:portal protein [Serratia sp. UGAL515B_01]|uniref:portal protein n=1 Tax=Serratia sp. UGAL515B_01 TaxID=2986763 RepID=UPI002954F542|nr:portal protein [Serratia sp. UGAL515B_01]WON77575.1 portal protein [Serratia sp. UGAL515B_01]
MEDNKRLHALLSHFDRDWSASEDARTEAVNDLYFSRISQWDDWLQDYSTLQYRGQFDVVRSIVRKLIAEMRQNPIEVMFRPKDGADPDAADTLMGMYRTDMRNNAAKGAVNIAVREQLETGFGAWRLVQEYEDEDELSNTQVIRRKPIHEAAAHVVWDANAKEIDKSDAKWCSIITPFTRDGWTVYAEENDLDPDLMPDFQSQDTQWTFPWMTTDCVYICEHYEVECKKETVYIYRNPMTGEPVSYYKADIKKVIDELSENGFEKVAERKVKKRRVYKSIITATAIIVDRERIAGEHIPIVPVYGEWGFAGDKEVYEGVVRGTKDGQRLRNFILSAGADTVARSPTKKPFFFAEQIKDYEAMYSGTDDYPYYLLNRTTENGNGELPLGPVGYMENPELPQANVLMLEAATAAVKEVSPQGVDAQAANGQVAFDTVNQLNQRADLGVYVYQDNLATAMRRDGEIYVSMVNELYDVPRKVLVTGEDGSEQEVELLSQVLDVQSGEVVTLNDIRGKFETYTDVGPSYQSMKAQNRAEILDLLSKVQPGTPEYQMLLLQYFTLLDGKGVEMMREYATKQLIMMGVKKPETPEQEQMLAQAQQQPKQPDAAMVLAQAEMKKADADEVTAQARMLSAHTESQRRDISAQVETVKARAMFEELKLKAYTTQQDAFEKQANTVRSLAQARNLDQKSVLETIQLMKDVNESNQLADMKIPGLSAENSTSQPAETPQTM